MAKRKPNTAYSGKLQFELCCKYETTTLTEHQNCSGLQNVNNETGKKPTNKDAVRFKANKCHHTGNEIKTQKTNEVETQRIELKGLEVPIA